MNLSFLSPIYLLGLLGIAVPVLIHLLTRRQQKRLRFSAVYLLFKSQKRSIKKSTPNRLLLLLIRCLAVALLSLALAHPLFSFGGPADLIPVKPSANVFILDDSYSMALSSGDKTLYDKAVHAVLKPIGKIPAGSAFSIVLASQPTRVLQGWTEDSTLAEKILKATKPSFKTTSIGEALTQALELLEEAPQKEKRIHVFTDLDKNGWNAEDFPESEKQQNTPVKILDFSHLKTGDNRAAVKNVEVSQEFLTNSRVIRVKSKVLNLEGRALNNLNITLSVNGKEQSRNTISLKANETVEKEFTFPIKVNEPISGTIQVADDSLGVDNKRFFSYQPDQKIKVLVVDGDPKTVAHQRETFYLENALSPFSVALSNIDLTVSTLEQLPERNLFDFSVLVLCNVSDLPFGYEIELEKYAMRGGALFITLGDQIDPKYYNEKLGNLLPVTIQSLNQVDRQSDPFRLKLEKSDHPVLKIFTGKSLQEMQSIRFYSLYSVEGRDNREFTVPLWFSNKYPAVVESEFGKGKVILYVTSIDRDWNNFPIQPTFLPWIQRWIKYSARGLESIQRQDLLIGEPFVWKEAIPGTALFVKFPSGKITQLIPIDGEASFNATFRPGVYSLFRGEREASGKSESEETRAQPVTSLPENALPAGAFTVNVNTRESEGGKISEEEIKNILGNLPVEISQGGDVDQAIAASKGFPLATPFLLLVAGMLFWEGWVVRRE